MFYIFFKLKTLKWCKNLFTGFRLLDKIYKGLDYYNMIKTIYLKTWSFKNVIWFNINDLKN